MRIAAVLTALVVLAAQAAAAPIKGAGAAGPRGQHAWLIISEADGQSTLLHAPPREAVRQGRVQVMAAELGSIRPVRNLATSPRHIAALGDRVYLWFDGERRRLLSLRAKASEFGESWSFQPPARLDPVPSPPEGDAIALVGASDRLWSLVAGEDGLVLSALASDGEWAATDLPTALAGTPIALVALGEGVAIVGPDSSGAVAVWALAETDASGWRRFGSFSRAVSDDAIMYAFASQVVLIEPDGDAAAITSLTDAGEVGLVRLEGIGSDFSVAPSRSGGERLVFLWSAGEDADEDADEFVAAEVSMATGTVLYLGPARRAVPVPAGQFRLLAFVLVGIAAVVLVVVLKPDTADALVIPSATALAEPSRRLVATMIDASIAAVAAGAIWDVNVLDVLSLAVLVNPDASWMAGPGMLVIGAAVGALSEAALGRTLGKMAVGCRVAPIGVGPGRLPVGRCLLRNLIKWLVPPVAALAIVDPQGRHRGDVFARAVVVVELEPDAKPDNKPDSKPED